MRKKWNKKCSTSELNKIWKMGYSIRTKQIGIVEGMEYRVYKVGNLRCLFFAKSERAAYTYIMKTLSLSIDTDTIECSSTLK